jgi:hypothetical protein
MKAKKSSPKSIRFNIKDFQEGMFKGDFESAQEMVDYLLKSYVNGEDVKFNVQETVQEVLIDKELKKADMWKLIRDNKV